MKNVVLKVVRELLICDVSASGLEPYPSGTGLDC
jgi:hypothetical protein